MQHGDQKYIDALLTNNVVLLDEIYRKYSGKIKWMVLQNDGNETDAADIFQDALLSIYNRAKGQPFTLTCPFDAFLYLVCKNKWLNELNKRKTHKVTIKDPGGYNTVGDDPFRLAEDCHLHEERTALLHEKLEQLGESCKQLLRLSWSGKAMDEVAGLLNVSYGYARKKKSECMAKLIMQVKQSTRFNALKW